MGLGICVRRVFRSVFFALGCGIAAAANSAGNWPDSNTGFGTTGDGLGQWLEASSYGIANTIDRGDTSGSIYSLIANQVTNTSIGDFEIIRRTSTGQIDTGFAASGLITSFPNSSASNFDAGICIDPSTHYIMLVGRTANSQNQPVAFAERLVPPTAGSGTATLDSSFNPAGQQPGVLILPAPAYTAISCRILPDSSIMVASAAPQGPQNNLLVARLNPDGSPAANFGVGGVQGVSIPGILPVPEGLDENVHAPNNHDVVIAGSSLSNTLQTTTPFVVALDRCAGTLDTNFDTAGILFYGLISTSTNTNAGFPRVLDNDQIAVVFSGNAVTNVPADLVTFPYPYTFGSNVTPAAELPGTFNFPANVSSPEPNYVGGLPLFEIGGTVTPAGNLLLEAARSETTPGGTIGEENVFALTGEQSLAYKPNLAYVSCGGDTTAKFTDANDHAVSMTTNAGKFAGAQAIAAPAGALTGIGYPNGWFSYSIDGLANGATATIQITLPAGSNPNGYEKCAGATCSQLPASNVSISGDVVTLTLVDGGIGDADGVANGKIVDPGAPTVTAAPAPSGGGGAISVELLALLALGSAAKRFRKRPRSAG